LEEDQTAAKLSWSKSKEKLDEEKDALSKQNLQLNAELVRQNTLLSELLNNKIDLEKEVSSLKQRIQALSSESKTLEAGLNQELQLKNENLKAKEAKLNQIINWQLQQESSLQDISAHLGETMTGYSEEQIEWFFSDNRLSVVLYQGFISPNDRTLTSEGQMAIEKLGSILKDYPSMQFQIVGHTDNSVGEVGKALEISTKRAVLIGTYLLEEIGLNGNQMTISGQGGYFPRVSNSTPAGRALNNRVEITIQSPVEQLWSLMED
jgi:chemotaxis protein MotB